MTTATVAEEQPHSWRRIAGWLGTAIAVAISLFWTLGDATFAITGIADEGAQMAWWVLWVLLGGGAAAALGWRRKRAFVVCVSTAAAAIIAPIGFFAPWWALVWVLRTERPRRVVIAGGLTAAAIAVTLVRDYARGHDALLAVVDEASGEPVVMHPAGYVAVGLICLGLAVAIGLVRRYRASARAARAAELRQSHTAAELRSELSRQEERDLIAREMHDTVAHHLALVSLHASALEITATEPGTDVPQAARSMRTNAQQALTEMRTLIATLRENSAPLAPEEPAGAAPDLAQLPVLIDEARRAGAQITPTILITDAHTAPPALTRGVYRIVQESLTNALKHAPGAPVMADVRAAPGRGVQITITNPLTSPGPLGGGPGGSGLVGMSERVQALGGTLQAGADDGAHVVQAELPWVVAHSGVGGSS